MEKVLNQDQIDAMVRAARGRPTEGIANEERVKPWNCAESGQIGRESLRAITQLHEAFARNLTHSLGAYLRVVFDANLVSVEQLPYSDVLTRFPELTYLATAHIEPANASVAFQMDLSLAFPIIDLLLGGIGEAEAEVREITEIEEQILDGVVRIVCKELEISWQPAGLAVSFEHRQTPGQMQQLMAPNEKTLALSFEIRMAESRGVFNVVCPSSVSNILLRKLADNWAYRRPKELSECSQQLIARLLECPFLAELSLEPQPMDARRLVELVPGETVQFERQVEQPVRLLVANQSCFEADVVRIGSRRAGHIGARIVPLQS
ncbi:MAG: FliM/FliN family flagellar motor switch protein [Terriglobia bacterium]|nr:FliM/FliN family flagellar motor switch protein [Terriglobia bacterium]